jgi:hypothetical protein
MLLRYSANLRAFRLPFVMDYDLWGDLPIGEVGRIRTGTVPPSLWRRYGSDACQI